MLLGEMSYIQRHRREGPASIRISMGDWLSDGMKSTIYFDDVRVF